MPPIDHDPVGRLNTHHQTQLLAVARVFGGHPEAEKAEATSIDPAGVNVVLMLPGGIVEEVRVDFGQGVPDLGPGTSMRVAFRELARRAQTAMNRGPDSREEL